MLKLQENIPSQIKSASSLALLLLLLVVSSCTIRKAFQTELELNIDKQLNPNKTTIAQNETCSSDYFKFLANRTNQTEHSFDFEFHLNVAKTSSTEKQLVFISNTSKGKQQVDFSGNPIPLYILYQQIKHCA